MSGNSLSERIADLEANSQGNQPILVLRGWDDGTYSIFGEASPHWDSVTEAWAANPQYSGGEPRVFRVIDAREHHENS